MADIILASESPRRKKLLQQIISSFRVEPSKINEQFNPDRSPESIVQKLSLGKAQSVAQQKIDKLIIGADTLVVCNNQILEKPGSPDEAFGMLKMLSDNKHHVYTGVALIKTDKKSNIERKLTFYELTDVYFGSLDDEVIRSYIKTGSPMDKAGSYGIQDNLGSLFVEKIAGDYNNVIGLPLYRLNQKLKQFYPKALEM